MGFQDADRAAYEAHESPRPACCDVLVIGGGPAGSTIATLLADKGWRVVLLEKQHHPRFHIGESLLPMNLPIFEQLGVLDAVKRIGVPKYGAQFNAPDDSKCPQTLYFSGAAEGDSATSFEVRRSEFDHLLLHNSIDKGVEVHEGVQVTDVRFAEGAPVCVHALDRNKESRTWIADYLVDASGRDTLLAKKFGLKRANRKHASAALFGHFKHVVRLPGRDAGNLSLYWFTHGWLWLIPLPDGITSVGAVCSPDYLKSRKASRDAFLWETIAQCPSLYRRMQDAELIAPVSAAGNYSYCATRSHGERYLLIGDAFAFVDPVFSTGVFLAMDSASQGAELVDACLRRDSSATRQLKAYHRRLRGGLKTIDWFIYRFNSPGIYTLFMAPKNLFGMRTAVLSVLAGDFFGKAGIKLPLMLFRVLYYTVQAYHYLRVRSARRNIMHLLPGKWRRQA